MEGGEEDDGYGVGEYMDGGVVAGSGADEGGAMGAHDGYSLPARLSGTCAVNSIERYREGRCTVGCPMIEHDHRACVREVFQVKYNNM